jgi:hypothetical protein
MSGEWQKSAPTGTSRFGRGLPLSAGSGHSLNHDRIGKPEPHAIIGAAPPDGQNQLLASISPLYGNRLFRQGFEQRQCRIRHLLVLPGGDWATLVDDC